MPLFQGNGIGICFAQHGSRTDPPLVLLHGIGCQLVQWPPRLLALLTAAGLRVVTPDNRDVGLSAKLDDLGTPDLAALMQGETDSAPYALRDMAADVVALLDHLGLMDAHVLGVSMGGMIAQHLAMGWPERVRSLISVMSSSGNPELPPPTPEAAAVLVAAPPGRDRASLIAHQRATWDVIGGPHHRSSEVGIGRLAEITVDRMQHPPGFLRQFAAIRSDGSRVDRLAALRVPTLVIHGDADPLVPPACGRDTAAAVPGARYQEIATMGHDLPEPLLEDFARRVIDFVEAVDRDRSGETTA